MQVTQRSYLIALQRVWRFARRHPRLTVYSTIVVLFVIWAVTFTITANRQKAEQDAFDRSPAGQAQAAAQEREISDKVDVDVALAMTRSYLRDPDSAQFIGVKLVRRGKKKGVCGYVNARNAFGGMVGNTAFAVIDLKVIMANNAYPKDLNHLDRLCYGR